MQSLYQAGPKEVPTSLTQPTKSFRNHVIIALVSLFLFVVVYLVLMTWFGRLAYDLFMAVANGAENSLFKVICGVCLAFLSIFMLKSLFIFKKNEGEIGKELKAEDEPLLFDYLYQLADEAGAPRPHRIFLTSRVNASVFYDLSILNLILPTKKNLEIGLGLINVLSLGELKAVLAHEFGHFAQRSMLLGRYVYTAQQIAVRVINKRDALDSIINGISSIDIRIAWIGWILSILVWAIRSLIQTLFSAVAVAEKALSREMEFQADLVAVSLTGSDALIHALHRLKIADEAYHAALDTINHQLQEKKAVQDLFILQSNHIQKMAWITNNSEYGNSPVNRSKDGSFRVFSSRAINPPEMWSTHPADKDREENAKQVYIYADIDERSSWDLFKNPEQLRREVTQELISSVKVETTALTEEECIIMMNKKDYDWSFLNPKYKGAYLERFSLSYYNRVDDVFSYQLKDTIETVYKELYPENLKEILENHKEIVEEIQSLTLVSHEVLTAEKRVIVHRGNRIKRTEIPEILKELKKEEQELRDRLIEHDKKCRVVSVEAASRVNPEVAHYLKSLTTLVHYAEHTLLDIGDMYSKFNNTLQVILADGKVSSSEMATLLGDCNEIQKILSNAFQAKDAIQLDNAIEEKLGKPYSEVLEEFTLGMANQDIIERWVNVVPGWVSTASEGILLLRNAALERLLDVEDEVKKSFQEKTPLKVTIGKVAVPEGYATLVKGNERELTYKLGLWDRFHASDGLLPTLAKFAVSAAIVIGALYVGSLGYESDLYIYNGLSRKVEVHFNDEVVTVLPHDYEKTSLEFEKENNIVALTTDGDTIENFKAKMRNRSSYVYNIARAGFAVQYTVSYGYDSNKEDKLLGTLKWFSTKADYILREPPAEIRTSGSRASREALTILSDINPYRILALVENEKQKEEVIMSHIKWDKEDAKYIMSWMSAAMEFDQSMNFLSHRLNRNPTEVISMRMLQDYTTPAIKDSVCKETEKLAMNHPESADYYYLNTRCMEDGVEQDNQFLKGSEKWPENGWLSFASAYIHGSRGELEKSYDAYANSINSLPGFMEALAPDFERIHRYLKLQGKSHSYWDQVLGESSYVGYVRQLENGVIIEEQGDVNVAYYYLHNGEIDRAVNFASKFEDDSKNFDWFAAASSNSKESLKNIVLSYDTSGLTASSVWIAIALNAKYNKNYSYLLKQAKQLAPNEEYDNKVTVAFLKAIKSGNLKTANESLSSVKGFHHQVLHQMMGLIILGEKAPEEWKSKVKTMLYIFEKPYFDFLAEGKLERIPINGIGSF